MTEGKARVAMGFGVMTLTRYLMQREGTSLDVAFRKLCTTKLYEILCNPESGLFLEPDDYLINALIAELEGGVDALKDAIAPDIY